MTTRDTKKTCSVILCRLVEEGLIKRYGNSRGSYRRIEGECEKIDWKNVLSSAFKLLKVARFAFDSWGRQE